MTTRSPDIAPSMSIATWVVLLVCAGCSRLADGQQLPQVVPDCVEYERALSRCFHRDVEIAKQTSLLARSDADRERIAHICNESLRQIRTACQ